MKYYLEVTEVLKKVVSVEAESSLEARRKVDYAYSESDIVLDYDNLDDVSIDLCVDQEFHRNEEERGYSTSQHID